MQRLRDGEGTAVFPTACVSGGCRSGPGVVPVVACSTQTGSRTAMGGSSATVLAPSLARVVH